MKKLLALALIVFVTACHSNPLKETYPYDLTEKEWNELSAKDKVKIRRDFYFYEKGQIDFVNPNIEVEGKRDRAFVPPAPSQAQSLLPDDLKE